MSRVNIAFEDIKFDYDEYNFIQLLGKDSNKIYSIVKFLEKYFCGKKYNDIDIRKIEDEKISLKMDGESVSRDRKAIIVLENIGDIIKHLEFNKTSLLYEYIENISESSLELYDLISDLEIKLSEYCKTLDKVMNREGSNLIKELSIHNLSHKSIMNNFLTINYYDRKDNELDFFYMKDREILEYFLNIVKKLSNSFKKEIEIILLGLDLFIDFNDYNYFINELREIGNIGVWNIPTREESIFTDREAYENTYIFNQEIIELEEFELTYRSICRNYPSERYPKENEVRESILYLLPRHIDSNSYIIEKSTIILKIFLDLMNISSNVYYKNLSLDELEIKYAKKA